MKEHPLWARAVSEVREVPRLMQDESASKRPIEIERNREDIANGKRTELNGERLAG